MGTITDKTSSIFVIPKSSSVTSSTNSSSFSSFSSSLNSSSFTKEVKKSLLTKLYNKGDLIYLGSISPSSSTMDGSFSILISNIPIWQLSE